MKQFENKVALVVGGTSGIGLATTQSLLTQGATVHIVGRSIDKVASTSGLQKHKVDITNKAEVAQLIDKISDLEQLDYLVNASGIFGPKPFLDHTVADYDSYQDLNRGFFFISQADCKCRVYVGKTSRKSYPLFCLLDAKGWIAFTYSAYGNGTSR